jgi:glycosyltransferase involved in cell wall biosynthesis
MRLAIVVPRYGTDVVGGAETLARRFAETAVARSWHVDVWTTCARDHLTWENHYAPGQTTLQSVPVTRFPITRWMTDKHEQLRQQLIKHASLTVDEQYEWLQTWVHSEPLYAHVAANSASYDAVLALPYLSSITYYAAWAAIDNLILLPCLHQELYAHLTPFHLLLQSAQGVLFLSPEEQSFAVKSLALNMRHHDILGMGIDIPSERNSTAMPQQESPYLLTIGRMEQGKNLALLYEYMERFNDEMGDLKLILLGRGSYLPPNSTIFEHRGFVSEAEKYALASGAVALCHPSLKESFSIVIMESWQMGRPVLVHRHCDVTRGHVERSQGGLTFATFAEFARAVSWLIQHPQEAEKLGVNGRRYVEHHFTWSLTLDHFEQAMMSWLNKST